MEPFVQGFLVFMGVVILVALIGLIISRETKKTTA
jgi:hypothetical protein